MDSEMDFKPCKKCDGTGYIGNKVCKKCSGEGFIIPEDITNLEINLDFYEDDLEDEY